MEGLMLPTTRYTTENEMEGLVLPTNRDDVAVNRLHVERWTGWCICRSVDGKMDKSGYMPHANAGGAGYMSFGWNKLDGEDGGAGAPRKERDDGAVNIPHVIYK
jgi:hypothetical protein